MPDNGPCSFCLFLFLYQQFGKDLFLFTVLTCIRIKYMMLAAKAPKA